MNEAKPGEVTLVYNTSDGAFAVAPGQTVTDNESNFDFNFDDDQPDLNGNDH